jgi:hypothetical protein
MYIRSEKINSTTESKDTLPINFEDIKYITGDGENKIGKMYLTFHKNLESIYHNLAMVGSPNHFKPSPNS